MLTILATLLDEGLNIGSSYRRKVAYVTLNRILLIVVQHAQEAMIHYKISNTDGLSSVTLIMIRAGSKYF